MKKQDLDPRLRLIQDADLKDHVVLVRVDHNVVKKGVIIDPYRINLTLKTLYAVAERGGRPILMTHVGRPRDKKTGRIDCREEESTRPIIQYLQDKLALRIFVPDFPIDPTFGIKEWGDSMRPAIDDLKKRKTNIIYLPNIRWFHGEEASGAEREAFVDWLARMGEVYVNDAFSSWRPHGSTYDLAKRLPSYAGYQLQDELINVQRVLDSSKPFVAVIGGAKYDTKIGPLKALYERADRVILGGLIYNIYLAAKYHVHFSGVSEEDISQAEELVRLDAKEKKIIEMPYLVESDTMEGKIEGRYRTIGIDGFKRGDAFQYVLDIDSQSVEKAEIKKVIGSANTIFVNAVMGLTPHFADGTRALYELIAQNKQAHKLFAGGDTLQELRALCPGIYIAGLNKTDYYYFTGGGSVLTSIQENGPYGLKPVQALMA